MFCHNTYLRWQGLSGPVPDGRGADIHVQRCAAETKKNFACNCIVTNCWTRCWRYLIHLLATAAKSLLVQVSVYGNFMFGSEMSGEDLHTVFEKGLLVNGIDGRGCRQNVRSHGVMADVLTSVCFHKTCAEHM